MQGKDISPLFYVLYYYSRLKMGKVARYLRGFLFYDAEWHASIRGGDAPPTMVMLFIF